jgi:hypothetical protein
MMLSGMEAVNIRAHVESGKKPNATAVQNLAILKFSVFRHLSLTTTKIIPYHFQFKMHLSPHFSELKLLNSRYYFYYSTVLEKKNIMFFSMNK